MGNGKSSKKPNTPSREPAGVWGRQEEQLHSRKRWPMGGNQARVMQLKWKTNLMLVLFDGLGRLLLLFFICLLLDPSVISFFSLTKEGKIALATLDFHNYI